MRNSWHVLFVGLLVLLLTSACSSPSPGVDQEFLDLLAGKLLFVSGLGESPAPFPSPAPGASYAEVERTMRAYSMGLYLISFQDSIEPWLLFDAVDGQRIDWRSSMSADMSFDSRWIALVAATRDTTNEIYVTRIDDSSWQQVSHSSWLKHDVAWSPDGTQVAFSARAEDTNADGIMDEGDATEIYTTPIDGSDLQQVTHNGGHSTDVSWSPDGEWLVYRLRTRRGQTHIDSLYLTNPRTGENRELLPALGGSAPVSWSPDSRFIAMAGPSGTEDPLWVGTDIYLIDVETGSRIKITDTHQYTPYCSWESGGIHLSNPVWSPDGEAIAFAWMWTDWDKHAIFVVSRDGSRLSQLTDWSGSGQIPLSWRP
jgi:Tol biopolymer transport system component